MVPHPAELKVKDMSRSGLGRGKPTLLDDEQPHYPLACPVGAQLHLEVALVQSKAMTAAHCPGPAGWLSKAIVPAWRVLSPPLQANSGAGLQQGSALQATSVATAEQSCPHTLCKARTNCLHCYAQRTQPWPMRVLC